MDFCALLRLPEVIPKDCSILRNLSSDCDIRHEKAATCTYKDLKLYEVNKKRPSLVIETITIQTFPPFFNQIAPGAIPQNPQDVKPNLLDSKMFIVQ